MSRHSPIALLLAASLLACAEQSPTAPLAPVSQRPDLGPTAIWASDVTGETGPGALYRLSVPSNWNGDVVYYAHGIVPPQMPVSLPNGDRFPAVREALGGLGYAVAYSSFSENGWAVKDGAQRTHQLRGIFAAQFGPPRRSFLMGTSMGGLVAQKLAEQFPKQYDGTLAMCAPLGGAKAQVDYIGNVRVLFDLFYKGVLAGDVLTAPAVVDVNAQVLGPAQRAVMTNPTGLGIIARMAQTPLAGANGGELGASLLYALGYHAIGINDFLDRTHGHSMFDNSLTVYSAAAPGTLPPSLLDFVNASVGRFTATPDALNYLGRYYRPDGALELPTLTMHTTRDPLVPFFHEAAFKSSVDAAGQSDLLVQRSYTRFGHCAFEPAEMVSAFQAVAEWARTGVRPTP